MVRLRRMSQPGHARYKQGRMKGWQSTMLERKEPRQADAEKVNPILSVRLNMGETARIEWLTDRLNMTRSEVVRALINQEYVAQYEREQQG